jgi:hypothetical protein
MPAAAVIYIYPDAAKRVTNTPECRSLLARVARAALNEAYGAAPVYTGEYQASLIAAADDGEHGEPRAVLASNSSFWHFVEYGALNTPPYHLLGESVRHQADEYEDLPKGSGG